MAENDFEETARCRKIAALAAVLDPVTDEPTLLRHLDETEWERVSEIAGVRPPSPRSVELLVESIGAMRRARRRVAELAIGHTPSR